MLQPQARRGGRGDPGGGAGGTGWGWARPRLPRRSTACLAQHPSAPVTQPPRPAGGAGTQRDRTRGARPPQAVQALQDGLPQPPTSCVRPPGPWLFLTYTPKGCSGSGLGGQGVTSHHRPLPQAHSLQDRADPGSSSRNSPPGPAPTCTVSRAASVDPLPPGRARPASRGALPASTNGRHSRTGAGMRAARPQPRKASWVQPASVSTPETRVTHAEARPARPPGAAPGARGARPPGSSPHPPNQRLTGLLPALEISLDFSGC